VENTLGLEIIEVVEQAAIVRSMDGQRRENIADQVAVEAARADEQNLYAGRIVIGEGERMKPHALYREEVGICTREDAKPTATLMN